jgi:hypothetical protein
MYNDPGGFVLNLSKSEERLRWKAKVRCFALFDRTVLCVSRALLYTFMTYGVLSL